MKAYININWLHVRYFWSLDRHVVDISVHTDDTNGVISFLDANVAILPPASAPGVKDDPVVFIASISANSISTSRAGGVHNLNWLWLGWDVLAALSSALALSVDPLLELPFLTLAILASLLLSRSPSADSFALVPVLTLARVGGGRGRRGRVAIVAIVAIGEIDTDKHDTVVDTRTAAESIGSLLGQNTWLVIHPAFAASLEGDTHRSFLKFRGHLRNISISPVCRSWCNRVIRLCSASIISCIVFRIVSISSASVLFGVAPIVAHPATTAAMGIRDTVDTLLLRKSDWGGVILNSLHGLLHTSCSEGPAWTTSALILDWNHLTAFNPIDVCVLNVL